MGARRFANAPPSGKHEPCELDVVTGAFSYTGKYITRRFLNAGRRVRTIAGHPKRPNSFGDQVEVVPMDFSDRAGLFQSLRGASVLMSRSFSSTTDRRYVA